MTIGSGSRFPVHPSIEALTRLMRPPLTGGEVVDWEAWREELGFDFPADYKDFIACYGAGAIDQFITIYSLAGDGRAWREEFENAPYMFYEDEYGLADPCPYPIQAGLNGLVLWGISSGPEYGFWYANGPDPDAWPVAIFNRGKIAWTEYAGGIGSFLVKLLSGELASPFSSNFPRAGIPEFLSERDEKRLRDLGISASRYELQPEVVVAEIEAAGLNPVDFFASATCYL